MATIFSVTYYKNDGTDRNVTFEAISKNTLDYITSVGAYWGAGAYAQDWSRTGYNFLYWNTAADGSGTSIPAGEIFTGKNATVYAIWQAIAGDDVVISLGETEIATMNATGSKTLATQGTYVADDITIEYTKPAAPTPSLQNKTVSPTTSSQSVTADSGYDGLGTVTVNAISPTKSTQTYTPTTSDQTIASGRWLTGMQTIKGDANLTAANIKKDVSIFGVTGTYEGSGVSLQAKTNITPTTSSQTITPDSGYDGLSSVQINAMPSGSAKTPGTTITANPSISVSNSGLITATASATQSVTPMIEEGYVAGGTAGLITVSGSNTSQLATQAATTYTPTTANQTIASGKYLTGAQTILGDANLTAANIKKDVSIFNVTGTYEGGGGGGGAPTLSTTPGSGLSYFRNIADLYDSSYNRADVYATPTVGDTIYFETQGRWELSSLYEKDTGTPVPYTTIFTASYGSKYSFIMPNVDVIFELYYND